jgi:lactoylglutathione lyase
MVKKLVHTRYRVNDLEKSVHFYKEVLGLIEVGRHTSKRGSNIVFLKAPESEEKVELCYYPASGDVKVPADLTHLAFEVDDLEAFSKHTASKGYPLVDNFIDAPEGYEIEVFQTKK